jgi:PadR family transcriptional regulator, regulatory protein AphA
LSSRERLNPFSYVILTLVGSGGAGPHDLRRNAEQGRMYWDAAPSQWYAEPKRLAKLGYLDAEKLPGRTRERTHYTLTDTGRAALEEWARTPVALPKIQNEGVVRLLAADLVPAEATLEGLAALRPQIEEQLAHLAAARERWKETVPHRVHLLSVNEKIAEGILHLQLEWLKEAEKVLRAQD